MVLFKSWGGEGSRIVKPMCLMIKTISYFPISLVPRTYQPQRGSLSVSRAGRRFWWLLSCFRVLCRNSCRANRTAHNHTTSCNYTISG